MSLALKSCYDLCYLLDNETPFGVLCESKRINEALLEYNIVFNIESSNESFIEDKL